MRKLHISPVGVDVPHQAFSPITNRSFASAPSMKERKADQSIACQNFLSGSFISRKFNKSLNFNKRASIAHRMKRSCSANLDEVFGDHNAEGLAQGFSSEDRGRTFSQNSSWQSHIDFLEPTTLGIMPEPPDWPERDLILWADIEQRAKSFDLPLSLRMIKKKHQREEALKGVGELASSSMTKAFSSTVFIIVELQSYALQMREALCNEDLKVIISKVQRDMHLSFVWLFQQVFSPTPALMVCMMSLLAEFGVYSTSQACLYGSLSRTTEELGSILHAQSDNLSVASTNFDNYGVGWEANSVINGRNEDSSYISTSRKHLMADPEELLQVGNQEFRSAAEVSLWNSLLDQATRMQPGPGEMVLNHDVLQKFVSPLSVEIEPDDYMEYHRTDLTYQMGLSQDPDNPLLLCNYAQFLRLVAHDYDRAEECFKRAIQVEPLDAESLGRYADFLWIVREDFWRAEDTYLQALSIEPENSYLASKYANFLWNTGGEETCFPLDASNSSSSRDSNM
ncbi:uncharacterized protein LOC113763698 isoform X1 [Coffea eugenioides]|uniref:uncharacterized protein LOC113763698 isoform X1 n=1 Tax=Coffea eugenioides TaxID=49369 RepID=UPI000F611778|nr:uncharacterized protein LOC113763698 isoform X1 [Coffea eugenioides]